MERPSCVCVRLLLLLLCIAAPLAAAPTGSSYLPGTGRFWHITDLHLDPTYHLDPDPTKVCFSSKKFPAAGAGPFGDFLCDSPYALIQSAFNHMAPLTQDQDFIIWTGDSPPHVPAEQLSTDTVIQVLANMTRTVRLHFPNLRVFPALGNHDYWPQDQMPSETNAVYQAAARLWEPWLKPDALLTLSQGGFYSQQVAPGLRLISLNTILYYGPDKTTANASDPAGQFQWLERTLEQAERDHQKVYVIAHVPLGFLPFAHNVTAVRKIHNERLVSIFRRHSAAVAGHFYGHTHRDSLMVLLDPKGEPLTSVFVSPAVTPIKGFYEPYSNNPALRMYLYHPKDFALLDVWQYFLNLTEANQSGRAEWRREYAMTSAFGLSDLRPLSLLRLGLGFLPPRSPTFDLYFRNFMVSYNTSATCGGACKVQQVCAVLHLDQASYSRCVEEGGR